MSVRELGRRLGISASLVSRLVRKGMPLEEEEARAWRLRFVRSRRREEFHRPAANVAPEPRVPEETQKGAAANTAPESGVKKIVEFEEDSSVPGGLEATLERLRRLERSAAVTLQRALKAGQIPEAIAMRQQHGQLLRSLFDAEAKLMKLAEQRGELVSVDRAVSMVYAAMSEAVILLRRLPDLGRDEAEKARLTAFMSAVLQAMRDGAEAGLKNGKVAASVAQQGG